MRYGMNPHQAAHEMNGNKPLTIINGEPSYINYLDALNAWQLVIEARDAVEVPVAASFKHVSPAGVATAGALDACTRETWAYQLRKTTHSCLAMRVRGMQIQSRLLEMSLQFLSRSTMNSLSS